MTVKGVKFIHLKIHLLPCCCDMSEPKSFECFVIIIMFPMRNAL